MRLIAENDEVLTYFSANRSLLSGSVKKFSMYAQTGLLVVELDVQLLYAKEHKLYTLRLVDVQQYGFYHTNEYEFYNITHLKLFKRDNLYYISLDPDGETSVAAETDNDFVLSKGIEAYAS